MCPFAHFVGALAVSVVGCGGASPSPASSSASAPSPTATTSSASAASGPPIRYDLTVAIDRKTRTLSVHGTMESATPIRQFFLHPQLSITALRSGTKDIPFHQARERVVLDAPATTLAFEYSGQMSAPPLPLVTDVKSAAWLSPYVRLTEITFWYPVMPRAGSGDSWPPAPAVAKLALPALDGLSWVTSGQKQADGTFRVDIPGELEITAVPTGGARETVTARSGEIVFDIQSPRAAAIAAKVRPLVEAHAARLGSVVTRDVATVVEFPVVSQNWLSFSSSDLLLFDSSSIDGLLAGESRATEIWAHELGHLWIGRALHPEGPLSRWLAESFAEYYAWRAIAKVRGEAEAHTFVARAEDDTAASKLRIDALAEDDDRLYTRGALAVRALAGVCGDDRFDGALRSIAQNHQAFTVANLFATLASAGVDDDALAKYRAAWGV